MMFVCCGPWKEHFSNNESSSSLIVIGMVLKPVGWLPLFKPWCRVSIGLKLEGNHQTSHYDHSSVPKMNDRWQCVMNSTIFPECECVHAAHWARPLHPPQHNFNRRTCHVDQSPVKILSISTEQFICLLSLKGAAFVQWSLHLSALPIERLWFQGCQEFAGIYFSVQIIWLKPEYQTLDTG